MVDGISTTGSGVIPQPLPAPSKEPADPAASRTTFTVVENKSPIPLELKGPQQIAFDRPSGDTVQLSDKARELAQKGTPSASDPAVSAVPAQPIPPAQPAPPQSTGQSATTAYGTSVELDTSGAAPALNFTTKTGEKVTLSLEAGEDLHIRETSRGLSILSKGQLTHHEYATPTMENEGTVLMNGNTGDDIFVNFSGKTVDAGEGNDIIINFADKAKISAGNGNDTLILAKPASGLEVDMGEGDNRITGAALQHSTVTVGSGRNDINVESITNTSINLTAPGRQKLPPQSTISSGSTVNTSAPAAPLTLSPETRANLAKLREQTQNWSPNQSLSTVPGVVAPDPESIEKAKNIRIKAAAEEAQNHARLNLEEIRHDSLSNGSLSGITESPQQIATERGTLQIMRRGAKAYAENGNASAASNVKSNDKISMENGKNKPLVINVPNAVRHMDINTGAAGNLTQSNLNTDSGKDSLLLGLMNTAAAGAGSGTRSNDVTSLLRTFAMAGAEDQ